MAAPTRDPDKSRERILAAALHEFAKRGFAGARVDVIAKRAKINKRMLYHYYEDKEGLFRAVLRHKIRERTGRAEQMTATEPSELVYWFNQNCHDMDWVRLLAWESLGQSEQGEVVEAKWRRQVTLDFINKFKRLQGAGKLRADVEARYLMLARASLATYPIALPHITKMITGQLPDAAIFQKQYSQFLEKFSSAFRP
ncbi:MAG TPA: TetR/AcrR family transcriptional regulator [Verrucomicrobiae bacterium]